nr:hypothetical protein [Haliscomenobacter sp.]
MVTLDIVRKPSYDWVGPEFRDHSEPLTGHLETAHLCWGVSAVYDLAKAAFSTAEQQEIRQALQEKGLTLCRRWLDKNQHLANWRSILASGAIVASVVLEDEVALTALLPELELCPQALQADGSYGESLQYGNYLALALTFAHEAVLRGFPQLFDAALINTISKCIPWFATSMFYQKPLADWGMSPGPEQRISTTAPPFFDPRAMCCCTSLPAAIHRSNRVWPSGFLTNTMSPLLPRARMIWPPWACATIGAF